jgi:type IV pilus assembly protein PilO
VEGTYHNLGFFFDRVGRLPRLVNVGNLKVKSQTKQTASNTISAACVATTFVYVETPPQPPGAPGRPGAAAPVAR